MSKKLESLYNWKVWDALKEGKLVYAIDLTGVRPKVILLWEYTVEQVARFMAQHKKDDDFTALFYVAVDAEEGDEDDDADC